MSVKISELPLLSSFAGNDILAGVDTSENVTSKIELSTLKNYIDTTYTAGTNIEISNTNVVSASNVYNKTETDALIEEKEEQIEELQEELDAVSTIYNAFPTVSGEGESVSLDGTAETKFKKIDLKGNTSQETTTGKNLANINYIDDIDSTNLKLVINNDTIILSNNGNSAGYANSNTTMSELCPNLQIGDTIYLFFNTTSSSSNKNIIYLNGYNHSLSNNGGTLTITQDILDSSVCFYGGYQETAIISNFMITKVNDSTYEPYTGGIASPNPTYPQDIHVVSGDNEILIRNIQLWDEVLEHGGYNLTTGEKNNTNYYRSANYISITPNTQMTFRKPIGKYTRVLFYDINKNFISAPDVIYTNYLNSHFTSPENAYYMTFLLDYINATYNNDIMVYYGNTDHDYEPYNGDTYELNLGVENLFNINNGTNYNVDNGSISIIDNKVRATNLGTGTGHRGGMYLGGDELLGKTITLSAKWDASHSDIGKINIITSNNSGGDRTALGVLETNGGSLTLTLPNSYTTGTQFTLVFYTNNSSQSAGVYVDYFDIQLEEGSIAHSYSEYGIEPIKMRKIGNYQDYFVRNTGKNLANIKILEVESTGVIVSTNNDSITLSNVSSSSGYVRFATTLSQLAPNLKVGDSAKLSYVVENALTSSDHIYLYGVNASWYNNDTKTITQDMLDSKIVVYGGYEVTTKFKQFMISTSNDTLYEPYGEGQWCKYNAIGSIVLDGSESGWALYNASGTAPRRFGLYQTKWYKNSIPLLSDYFIGGEYNSQVDLSIWTQTSYLAITDKNSKWANANALKTWLGTHNSIVDYITNKPYLSLIESETLINQLDAIEKAMSYNSQTNISQVSNDKPFIISAEAIMSLQNVLDRIELLES